MVNNKVIEKIQKLLNLANSPDENEAKAATAMANSLLLKHNLSMQQIKEHQNEYIKEDTIDGGYNLKPHHDSITSLLINFFFVRCIIHSKYDGHSSGQYGIPKARFRKIIQLVGTKENVQIATYIFQYLDKAYPELWKDYYDRNATIKTSDRKSFYMGLTAGISKLLEETKWKVQEEMGLVLVEDPGLKKFVDQISDGAYGKNSSSSLNPEVFQDGIETGKNITLRKPIESTSSQNETKFLSKSK